MKKKILVLLTSLVLAASLSVCLAACSNNGDDGETDNNTPSTTNVLAAPTDFTFNTETGEYSFTANDANAGYYFIRAYKVINGVDEATYTVSSSRINGGTTGKITGSLDTSAFGWGEYDINLVTFKAAGTDYTAPDPVCLSAQYGIGGKMERPEMLAMYSGNTVELVIDWYTLNNYYMYATMPEIEFNFYSDENCTQKVYTSTVDLSDLLATIDIHPAGGYIWGYSNSVLFQPLSADGAAQGYLYDAYDFTTDDLGGAGTYYVTAQALAPASYITASDVSTVVSFTLTEDEATSTYESSTTALWEAPGSMGVPCAMTSSTNCGSSSTRVDFGGNQTTTSQTIK